VSVCVRPQGGSRTVWQRWSRCVIAIFESLVVIWKMATEARSATERDTADGWEPIKTHFIQRKHWYWVIKHIYRSIAHLCFINIALTHKHHCSNRVQCYNEMVQQSSQVLQWDGVFTMFRLIYLRFVPCDL